mmetsp:Transcript_48674/g.127195  ORF Transcript_48674/g.127195 Transcript_48674/m.127195 type:complete len:232 (+) Transcript_48674:50-745(+)
MVRSTRTWVIRSTCMWTTAGGVIGGSISVIVNNALIEISLTPFFAGIFGIVLVMLGGLMVWRKLWEAHEAPCMRMLVLSFSSLVLLSGFSCFLLEKDWFKTIPPNAKIPMYMSLGISLCFSVSFTAVDLLNAYHDRHSYDMRRRSLVSTPQQVGVVLAGAVAQGAAFGLMFGAMDVEDAPQKLRTEERASLPIGILLGGIVGGVNAVLSYKAEAGLGEQIDLLRSEGLLDD